MASTNSVKDAKELLALLRSVKRSSHGRFGAQVLAPILASNPLLLPAIKQFVKDDKMGDEVASSRKRPSEISTVMDSLLSAQNVLRQIIPVDETVIIPGLFNPGQVPPSEKEQLEVHYSCLVKCDRNLNDLALDIAYNKGHSVYYALNHAKLDPSDSFFVTRGGLPALTPYLKFFLMCDQYPRIRRSRLPFEVLVRCQASLLTKLRCPEYSSLRATLSMPLEPQKLTLNFATSMLAWPEGSEVDPDGKMAKCKSNLADFRTANTIGMVVEDHDSRVELLTRVAVMDVEEEGENEEGEEEETPYSEELVSNTPTTSQEFSNGLASMAL